MGDKGVARNTVTSAGVHVVPGTEGEGALTDEELIAIAPKIGFPLLIKATAGGGGKGMRQVDSSETLPGLIQAARREAESSFGDGNVYFEKLLVNARHIEFQILADRHGNVIHLGERECSLQRRHQKLLEESPSPLLDHDLRQRMGKVACTAARAVDYVNAGTIEFLVDTDQNFYFLEMNTRLQVEHPVTEIVTGIDIVKEQILIAQGAKLRFQQEDIVQNGWAIECRINAEDPYNNFMPSTGTLREVSPPTGPGVRVDSGVFSGIMISPYYDSLISKLICWGENRTDAITRMRRALMEYVIVGVTTNIPFHQRIMDSHHFVTGQFDTRFVEERFSMDEAESDLESIPHIAATLAALAMHRNTHRVAKVAQEEKRPKHGWKWAGRMDRLSD
jgi:acetyl/propionyl-CoA carboxylase alpha subunit